MSVKVTGAARGSKLGEKGGSKEALSASLQVRGEGGLVWSRKNREFQRNSDLFRG